MEATDATPGLFDMTRYGDTGAPVLFLHGEDGFLFNHGFLSRLGEDFQVFAPLHPGWSQGRPKEMRTLDDIAYRYLELIEQFDRPVILVGASLGGWLAAEVATKCRHGIRACVLISPVGIKTTARHDRTFVDLYAVAPEERERCLYADPRNVPAYASLTAEQYLSLAYAEEAVARFGWEPYLYNPGLSHRLRRIGVPTAIIAGAADTFVLDPGYYEEFARLVGTDTVLRLVEGAGHRVEEEAPNEVALLIAEFVEAHAKGGGDARVGAQ